MLFPSFHVIKHCETAFSKSNVNYIRSIQNSSEVIEKLQLRNFQDSEVSSFDFSSLYITLPHDQCCVLLTCVSKESQKRTSVPSVPVIIERTIGLVLGPSAALYEPFLKHCTLTNKAVGTI